MLLVDVTGKDEAVAKLLRKPNDSQVAKGSKVTTKKLAGQTVTMFELKKKEGTSPEASVLCRATKPVDRHRQRSHHRFGVGIDPKAGGEFAGESGRVQGCQRACCEGRWRSAAAGSLVCESFPLCRSRAMAGGKKARSRHPEGLSRASRVQAAAGYVSLGSGENAVVHHSYIRPERSPKQPPGTSINWRCGNNLPNQKTALPPAWVPSHSGTFLSLNWKMRNAFDKYPGLAGRSVRR